MQARFNPAAGCFWLEHEKSMSIGYLAAPMLAHIVMQNAWPINRHSEIGFDRARMVYGIAEGTTICFLLMCCYLHD